MKTIIKAYKVDSATPRDSNAYNLRRKMLYCERQYAVWTCIKVKSCLFSFILYWKIIIIPNVGFVLIFISKSGIIMSREDTYYYLLLLSTLLYYFHRHKFRMNFLLKFILMYSIYSTLLYNRESIISFYLKNQNQFEFNMKKSIFVIFTIVYVVHAMEKYY